MFSFLLTKLYFGFVAFCHEWILFLWQGEKDSTILHDFMNRTSYISFARLLFGQRQK